MAVETIDKAWQLGWRITARCAWGKRDGVSNPQFNDIDMHVAGVLEQAKEISRPRIDGFIEKAASCRDNVSRDCKMRRGLL